MASTPTHDSLAAACARRAAARRRLLLRERRRVVRGDGGGDGEGVTALAKGVTEGVAEVVAAKGVRSAPHRGRLGLPSGGG